MRILRFPDLHGVKGIPYSRMHIDRLEKVGQFPKRVKLGPGCVGWVEEEVDAYVNAKMAARNEAA